jgi:hypothetical protein
MSTYFVLAKKTVTPLMPNDSDWPKVIAYSSEKDAFLLLEGNGHGLMGGEIPRSEITQGRWKETFEQIDAGKVYSIIVKTIMDNKKNFPELLVSATGSLEMLEY